MKAVSAFARGKGSPDWRNQSPAITTPSDSRSASKRGAVPS